MTNIRKGRKEREEDAFIRLKLYCTRKEEDKINEE